MSFLERAINHALADSGKAGRGLRLAGEGGFDTDQRRPWRSGVYCVMMQWGASGHLVHKCDYCMSFPTEGSLKQSEIELYLCCKS